MPRHIIDTSQLKKRVQCKPQSYPICLNLDCNLRSQCLHALETTEQRMRSTIITCVNPKAYTTGSCTAYRDKDVKCHYAFGFRNIAAKLKVIGQYQTFMSLCLRYYCRTVYYDMYSGHHIITPHDQSTIIRCASDVGLNLPPHPFDEEVEAIDW